MCRLNPRIVSGVMLCATALGWGDPIPVVGASVGTRIPTRERVASVASALGADALTGEALRTALGPAIGDAAPVGDPLATLRTTAERLVRSYLSTGESRETRRAMVPTIAAMEAQPLALEVTDDTLHAVLRMKACLARMAYEAGHLAEADEYFRQIAVADPQWSLDPHEFQPEVVRRHIAAVTAVARRPHGELLIHVARGGCDVRVDGRRVSEAASSQVSVLFDRHRVAVVCGGVMSRVHSVNVVEGHVAEISVDPVLDAQLDLSVGLSLRFDERTTAESIDRAATSLVHTLGARRVAVVTADTVRLLDGATGATLATAQDGAALGRRIHAAPSVVAPVTATSHERNASIGAGPITLFAVGGAGVVGAGVFYILRLTALSALTAASNAPCTSNQSGNVIQCPLGPFGTAAQTDAARAVTMTQLSAVSLGVGLAAGAGAVLWMLMGRGTRAPLTATMVPTEHGLGVGFGGDL